MTESERAETPQRQSRTTGYHNVLHDAGPLNGLDDYINQPPSYERACLATERSTRRIVPFVEPGKEVLPPYSCSIEDSCIAHVKYERNNPFESLEDASWSEVYLVLQGTRLSFHQVQTPNIFSKQKSMFTPGRLVKAYTLQHAEVGIASDHKKYEQVCKNPMTALLPQAMQDRMKQTEPQLFDSVRMYVIRVRVECDQVLLRFRSWDERAKWIDQLCAAVDIAPALDERSEPFKHTLPRRRRHRHQRQAAQGTSTQLASLVEQQQRIIRERYPHLLVNQESDAQDEEPDITNEDPEAEDLDPGVGNIDQEQDPMSPISPQGTNHNDGRNSTNENEQNSINDDNEANPNATLGEQPENVDFDAESPAATPAAIDNTADPIQGLQRTLPVPPVNRPFAMALHLNTNVNGTTPTLYPKLPPTTQLDAAGEARYRRRCMPSLLHNSRRGNNDVVIYAGSRWRIDWKAKVLRPWPEQPPRYTKAAIEGLSINTSNLEGTFSFSTTPNGPPSAPGTNTASFAAGKDKDKLNKAALRRVRSNAELVHGPGRDPNLNLIGIGSRTTRRTGTNETHSSGKKDKGRHSSEENAEDNNKNNSVGITRSGTTSVESSSAESSLNAPEDQGSKTRMLFKDMGRRMRFGRKKNEEEEARGVAAAGKGKGNIEAAQQLKTSRTRDFNLSEDGVRMLG